MASIFDAPPPPVYTRDGRDGFPPEAEFEGIMMEYVDGLNPRKRDKALMTQAMYDAILVILTSPPSETKGGTAQFRFWTKKMFRLVTTAHAQIVTHENRPVAVREQIYDVLVQCHQQCSHGGRDKTSNQVRRYYSWIPKELIARFVKACPLCNARKTAKAGGGTAGLVALGVLGAEIGALYANSLPPSECSSPPSDSVDGSSGINTPSKQSRPSTGNNVVSVNGYSNNIGNEDGAAPVSWPPYLVQAGFPMTQSSVPVPYSAGYAYPEFQYQQYATQNLPSSVYSALPPMPSPVKQPAQDWTQWVNTTPQRSDNAQTFSNDNVNVPLPPSQKDIPFIGHGTGKGIATSDRTPTLQQAQIGASAPNRVDFVNQQGDTPMRAPSMACGGSTDSMDSLTSASTNSSSDSEEQASLATPLNAVDSSSANVDRSILNSKAQAFGQSIPASKVKQTISSFDEDEQSFQTFMTAFKANPVEPGQIDPLLRAMNLEHMPGVPSVPFDEDLPISNYDSTSSVVESLPSRALEQNKPNGQCNTKSAGPTSLHLTANLQRDLSHSNDSCTEPAYSDTSVETKLAGEPRQTQSSGNLGDAMDSYQQLSGVFSNIWQGSNHSNNSLDNNIGKVDYTALDTYSVGTNGQYSGGVGQNALNQTSAEPYGQFSFNIFDTSSNLQETSFTSDGSQGTSFNAIPSNNNGLSVTDEKQRPRPPGLNLASFSNNNAFTQMEAGPHSAFDWQTNFDTFLSPCDINMNNVTSHAMTGSLSAPPQMMTFADSNALLDQAMLSAGLDQNYLDLSIYNTSYSGDNSFATTGGYTSAATSAYTDFQSAYPPYSNSNTDFSGHLQQQPLMDMQRPASAAEYLEPQSAPPVSHVGMNLGSNVVGNNKMQQSLAPAIHSAPFFHLPMSAQQHQAQARELSEQIQAILDSAVPNPEALAAQQASLHGTGRQR